MKRSGFLFILIFLFISLLSFSNDTLIIANDSIPIDTVVKEKQTISKKFDVDKKLKVYTFKIMEEINKPAWHKTKKAFEEAKELGCDIILIHMNTYGGRLDVADSIRTIIMRSKIPVYVFIDNNAASAGALISIACDSIYMRPDANIGAATVVNQEGEVVADKYQSYMRSLMRSTAEQSGRDPDIAQAMVDPSIYIEGISDSGKVVTFTASEAISNGFCEAIAENINEVLDKANIKEYQIVEQKLTVTDYIIGIFVNPVVSGILIILIIAGIYFEMQTPGIGFPLALAVLAALAYFAPLYVEGLAENWEIVIFIVGLILIAIEIFAIPGFGVFGISGIFLVVAGLTLSLIDNVSFDFSHVNTERIVRAFFTVVIAISFSIIGSIYLSKKLFTQRTIFGQLSLDSIQEASKGYVGVDETIFNMVGKTGTAATILRPAGKVVIDDGYYDATAETGYIEKGDKIKVIKFEGAQIVVRKED
ncbi:MAG: hypothetical protein K9J13_10625 [Saprospiraceae bacterium]|nr:hypothetical protein [Saprospiraceae bacterium]